MKTRRLAFLTCPSPHLTPPRRQCSSTCRGREAVATNRAAQEGSTRLTLGEDVPLHDPYERVATGAICLQVHEVPLEPGRPALQDRPAFLEELFGVNGLQMFWVRGLQILRVLGGGAAVQGLGESAIESARAVSHGTGCREGKENTITHSAPFPAFLHFPPGSARGESFYCPQKQRP